MTELFPSSVSVVKDAPSAGDSGLGGIVRNFSVAAQVLTAATLTYITGSQLKVPLTGLKVGSKIKFRLNVTKTAAGTATSTYAIVFGTAGDSTDTARVSFTKPIGDATADNGLIEIEATVRSVGAAGVVVGEFRMTHNLASTGHMTIPAASIFVTSAGFANNTADLYVGLVATTGASDAITVNQVEASLSGV